ncbi:MAG: hypothetical protein RID53_15305 [Coleofasciculus sp. B1-GNL1-01]|uniref:hypothetical protein n=1 Tax=Coleofasciculus sp. B1-GNL1-01 TaxID=3068484 RepID=UPI0032FF3EA3
MPTLHSTLILICDRTAPYPDFSGKISKSARVGAGLVTSGYNRKDSSETRPYTISLHCATYCGKKDPSSLTA